MRRQKMRMGSHKMPILFFSLFLGKVNCVMNARAKRRKQMLKKKRPRRIYIQFLNQNLVDHFHQLKWKLWLCGVEDDKYSPELIQMALREAVCSQVYNFKYIDRILINWEKKNIRTKEQVEKETKNYRERSNTNRVETNDDELSEPVPMINWLKDLNKND